LIRDELSRIRHKLRGRVQALNLCATALGLGTTQQEDLQFVDDIQEAATEIGQLMDELEKMQPGWGEGDDE
jgi:hypothetical protein